MITTVLCYSATSGSSVADYGKPSRVDMGNVGYNAAAGLTNAYSRSTPVLLIAGQIPRGAIGKNIGAVHEIADQPGTVRSVTKWQRQALRGCVRSLGHVLEWRHEPQTIPQRPDRRTVGCSGFPTPISQDRGKATYCRPTGGRQRHCVRSAQRLHVASPAA